jgi:hypothetical protein
MKKIIGAGLMMMFLGFAQVSEAQSKVKRGAQKTVNKTAEVASKGKAKATDQVHKDKIGPNGETIYMDNHSRYYSIDKKGRRHYIPAEALKNKLDDE